jgi:hypothetical protein
MTGRYLRDARLYEDARGKSGIRSELVRIGRSDPRALRTIQNKIGLLRQQTLDDALRSRLIKRPSKHIYVLRVQSGPAAYRLPFFESPCGGALIVLTSVEHRRDLGRERAYGALIEEAERLRTDWITRNCKE